MRVYISGGTGTLGREITRQLLNCSLAERIVIYSRDEAKHQAMEQEFPEYPQNIMRYIVGDVRSPSRVMQSMSGCDVVIHAAAMKHIEKCEYNASEAIETNVIGTRNVAEACVHHGVKSAFFVSTDKACMPISGYGAQKAVGEHLWIASNNLSHKTAFNCVRYGNVTGSKGSIEYLWKDKKKEDVINVTSDEMTRFFFSIQQAAEFIIGCILESQNHNERGCIYVPKMKRDRIINIAGRYSNNIKITGMRCSEKIHEDLISNHEAGHTYENDQKYIIYPAYHSWANNISHRGIRCKEDFSMSSKIMADQV